MVDGPSIFSADIFWNIYNLDFGALFSSSLLLKLASPYKISIPAFCHSLNPSAGYSKIKRNLSLCSVGFWIVSQGVDGFLHVWNTQWVLLSIIFITLFTDDVSHWKYLHDSCTAPTFLSEASRNYVLIWSREYHFGRVVMKTKTEIILFQFHNCCLSTPLPDDTWLAGATAVQYP